MLTKFTIVCFLLTGCLDESDDKVPDPCGAEPHRPFVPLIYTPDDPVYGPLARMEWSDWAAISAWADAEQMWGRCEISR